MTESTKELVEVARDRIAAYTDGFSGDIGKKFKRVDARLDRAIEAIEDAETDTDEVREHLEDAQDDVNRVIRTCFTGVTPGNLEQYVERPIEQAVESVE